jgi:hypothetical protein
MSVVTFKKVKHVSIGATCIAYFHASNVMYECNLITFSKYIFHSCLFLLPAFISLLPVCPLLPISTLPRTPLTPSFPPILLSSTIHLPAFSAIICNSSAMFGGGINLLSVPLFEDAPVFPRTFDCFTFVAGLILFLFLNRACKRCCA